MESVQLSSLVLAPSITTNGIDEGPATFGYGTLGLGSALVLAFLYKKQMDAKGENDVNGDDEDFQRVDDQLMTDEVECGPVGNNDNDEDFIRVEEDDFDEM